MKTPRSIRSSIVPPNETGKQKEYRLAYRFMLEVPESHRKDAEISVGANPETQIVTSRASYPHGYDRPFRSLTVSSENLRVVESIYNWFEATGEPIDSSIVLFSGERLPLADTQSGAAISAIRRDQPWIDHAVPRIGDHVREGRMHEDIVDQLSQEIMDEAGESIREDLVAVSDTPGIGIEAFNYFAISVGDLRKAEAYYQSFFAMEIIGRTRTLEDGSLQLVEPDYSWDRAIATETSADDTYLRNGPLTIALHRVGLGARLSATVLNRVSIRVDGTTFGRVRSQALMRSMEIHTIEDSRMMFRDPFGVVWELSVAGLLPEILMQSIRGRA